MKTNIIVTLQVQGVHRWIGCPFKEVGYLRDYHRHVFHISAVKQVSHNDRDVEIILFKNRLTDYLNTKYKKQDSQHLFFDGLSCEMIAEELLKEFSLISCTVLEDNENGAQVTL